MASLLERNRGKMALRDLKREEGESERGRKS